MKSNKEIVRISEIKQIDDYKVFCKFNNGEDRYIDFKNLFESWNIKENDAEYPLLNLKEFKKVQLANGTLSWNNISVLLIDENNKEQSYPYEIDPIVLYQHSKLDLDKLFNNIGLLLKSEREKSGLTKKQLAKKSGISEEYISQLENEKTNIELLMLRDIMNKGFGKRLKISVE